jgi:hypothetical protein
LSSTFSYNVGSSGTLGNAGTSGANGGSGGTGYSEVTEYYSTSAPLLVGSVTSNTSGMERIERARFSNSGTCAATSQSGSWLGTPTDPGTGQCGVVIASGIFSSTPSCVCSAEDAGGSVFGCVVNPSSATLVTVTTENTTTGAATDRQFHIICMGPR